VPDSCGGTMEFALRNGWTLCLTYYPKDDQMFGAWEADPVEAEFIPPIGEERPEQYQRDEARPAEPAIDAEG